MMITLVIAIVWLDIGHVPTIRKKCEPLQASSKDKSKRVETHAIKNALDKVNVEINNALVKKISFAHEVAKSLEISNFFKDLDWHDKASD